MRPVYFINGFLESGKSQFLKFTLAQDYFQIKGKTLLVLCEEGVEEYDAALLKKSKTIVEIIENEEDFTADKLMELEKEWKPERVVIEYNGMWNNKDIKLPFHWNIEQQITCINAATFSSYFGNMKSMVADMVRNSELIIFNRCDTVMDSLGVYRRNIKAVNANAAVVFENKDGEINEIFEEDLPYDLKSDVIELTDQSYGLWYLDVMDHIERYEGKTLKFVASVLKPDGFDGDFFVPGRMAMTCCAEDISFLGYVCMYKDAKKLKNKEWITLTATIKNEYFAGYKGEGPVLHAISVEPANNPKEEIIGIN